jgi:uncharacterized protein with NRDE domain
MCVLSYVPTNTGFIISHNRDESYLRPMAVPPQRYGSMTYAKDTLAGGTWLAYGQKYVLALINGAQKNHKPKARYNKSRGAVITDFFENNWLETVPGLSYFADFQNFSLIIATSGVLKEIIWDGAMVHTKLLNPMKRYMWSSSTLYTDAVKQTRSQLFESHILMNEPTAQVVAQFHLEGNLGIPSQNLRMFRNNGIYSQCFMQVQLCKAQLSHHYIELSPLGLLPTI